MRIGFDAKRALYNNSGLGNYSRNIIYSVSRYKELNDYLLYAPYRKTTIRFPYSSNVRIIHPGPIGRLLPSYWRSMSMTSDLQRDGIHLYHGLSNELPMGIRSLSIPSVVTIHDVIFMRYPEFYSMIDRAIYEKKFRHAIDASSRIIAASNQTRDDLVEFLGADRMKIDVVYQPCHPQFYCTPQEEDLQIVRNKYNLPKNFILTVGTIEKRKNILAVIKAVHKGKLNIPVVNIGRPTDYMRKIEMYIEENNVKDIHFLPNVNSEDLPLIYRMASALVYPSFFEGFGIPILEAMVSGIPVITSNGSCLSEVASKAALYVNPSSTEELMVALKRVLLDEHTRSLMVEEGFRRAELCSPDKIASDIMKVYQKVI